MKQVPDDIEHFFSLSIEVNSVVVNDMTFLKLFQQNLNVIYNVLCRELITWRNLIFLNEFHTILSP